MTTYGVLPRARVVPDKVHTHLVYALMCQFDEWATRDRFEPRSQSLAELKETSKWLKQVGILRFDPLENR